MNAPSANIHRGWISSLAFYLFLLLVVLIGLPQLPFHFLGHEILITDLLFLIAGPFWLVSILLRQGRFVWIGFYWPMGAYLLALLISSLFSVDQTVSLIRLPEEGYLLCLTLLAVNLIISATDLKNVIIAWLAGTSIAVVIGLFTIGLFYAEPNSPLLESLTYHYGSVPVGNYPRITAGFVSASMLCNYLNVSLVLSVLAAARGWLPIKLAFVLAFTILLASIFTFSIGLGGVAFAIAIFALQFIDFRKSVKSMILVGGCLVSLIFLLVSPFALVPYPGAGILLNIPFLNIDLMPSARLLVWNDAVRTFLSHPLTGVGLGRPVASVVFANTGGDLSLLTDAHNSFLSVAAQNGIIGLAAFIFLVYAITRRWSISIRQTPTTTVTALGTAFLCSFVYQGLTGSFEDARHLWILIGMFWAAYRFEQIEN